MKYAEAVQPFSSAAEFEAWAFQRLGAACSIIAQYEADEQKRRDDRIRENLKPKRDRGAQVEQLARDLFDATYYGSSVSYSDNFRRLFTIRAGKLIDMGWRKADSDA